MCEHCFWISYALILPIRCSLSEFALDLDTWYEVFRLLFLQAEGSEAQPYSSELLTQIEICAEADHDTRSKHSIPGTELYLLAADIDKHPPGVGEVCHDRNESEAVPMRG
ncbi:hypothetical protein BAUCODRAFT_33003 [Baudoinia panamericana UAMH 10762]|uniref:Uncharacterized protein n=1 Tax=Baudoinia panamericana (strain UAMH 10762) TaxID=717646 RepID=M2NDG0_BAUPA|nr:uncharacterized protein BAUCODRAFT_33003 [Baudoinia panamericana UAMH 10762]EMC97259.1 hypothetical protein BAUCODRAFT_33003 [Baudoinia panamericana UAMH 10762]